MILKAPAFVFPSLPGPTFWRRFSGQHAWEIEPDQAGGGLAMAGILLFLRRNLNTPGRRSALRNHQRKWIFAELNKDSAIAPGREQKFACNLLLPAPGVPDRLSLANGPAGLLEVCRRERAGGLAADEQNHYGKQK